MKKYSNLSSAAVVTGALRVKLSLFLFIYLFFYVFFFIIYLFMQQHVK